MRHLHRTVHVCSLALLVFGVPACETPEVGGNGVGDRWDVADEPAGSLAEANPADDEVECEDPSGECSPPSPQDPGPDDDDPASDETSDEDNTESPPVAAAGCCSGPSCEGSCHAGALVAHIDGVGFLHTCHDSFLRLIPNVQIGGKWVGGGNDGQCALEGTALSCPVSGFGRVVVNVEGNKAVVRFFAAIPVLVEGLALEGMARVPGANAWLSNGYQSFSQSGVLALGARPSQGRLRTALLQTGEDEVYRGGDIFSWWLTYVGGGPVSLFAGALTADRFQPWFQVNKTDTETAFLRVRFVSGGVGEEVAVSAGGSVDSETFQIELGEDLVRILECHGQLLQSRLRDNDIPAAVGWNSWYNLWLGVDPEAVRENAALLMALFGTRFPEANSPPYVVIDGGWARGFGDWEPNETFADSMQGLATEIRELGLRPGVWIAPLVTDPGLPVHQEHPEWFVRDATADNPVTGEAPILDVTHPEAAAYLAKTIRKLVGWGYELLKLDFMYAGALEGRRVQPVTGLEAYHRALQIIREAAGEDVQLIASGAPPVPSFPYVDAWRSGNDIAFGVIGPWWSFIANQARNFTSRWQYCLATYCDGDPPLLRRLPKEEVETGAWVAAAGGGVLFLSDDLRTLPEERHTWGLDEQKMGLALGRRPAVPESPFPEDLPRTLVNMKTDFLLGDSHAIPHIWRLPDNTRIALNFSNWRRTIEEVEVPRHGVRMLPDPDAAPGD